MHPYRTHNCGQLRASDVGSSVRISGWIHRKRDHGGVLFIDLRDHFGITQVVAAAGSPMLEQLDALRAESVVSITGDVVARGPEVVNKKLPTGEIEVVAREV
ncbi:MAG TPA: OB-fold nucleic acid binding domain-containing protein, partial [Thermoanaerobaculia bacterium]|nr:OB-fold nucleic acid binding domain-containing protein [Thermoanaerobaculia bacterium]